MIASAIVLLLATCGIAFPKLKTIEQRREEVCDACNGTVVYRHDECICLVPTIQDITCVNWDLDTVKSLGMKPMLAPSDNQTAWMLLGGLEIENKTEKVVLVPLENKAVIDVYKPPIPGRPADTGFSRIKTITKKSVEDQDKNQSAEVEPNDAGADKNKVAKVVAGIKDPGRGGGPNPNVEKVSDADTDGNKNVSGHYIRKPLKKEMIEKNEALQKTKERTDSPLKGPSKDEGKRIKEIKSGEDTLIEINPVNDSPKQEKIEDNHKSELIYKLGELNVQNRKESIPKLSNQEQMDMGEIPGTPKIKAVYDQGDAVFPRREDKIRVATVDKEFPYIATDQALFSKDEKDVTGDMMYEKTPMKLFLVSKELQPAVVLDFDKSEEGYASSSSSKESSEDASYSTVDANESLKSNSEEEVFRKVYQLLTNIINSGNGGQGEVAARKILEKVVDMEGDHRKAWSFPESLGGGFQGLPKVRKKGQLESSREATWRPDPDVEFENAGWHRFAPPLQSHQVRHHSREGGLLSVQRSEPPSPWSPGRHVARRPPPPPRGYPAPRVPALGSMGRPRSPTWTHHQKLPSYGPHHITTTTTKRINHHPKQHKPSFILLVRRPRTEDF